MNVNVKTTTLWHKMYNNKKVPLHTCTQKVLDVQCGTHNTKIPQGNLVQIHEPMILTSFQKLTVNSSNMKVTYMYIRRNEYMQISIYSILKVYWHTTFTCTLYMYNNDQTKQSIMHVTVNLYTRTDCMVQYVYVIKIKNVLIMIFSNWVFRIPSSSYVISIRISLIVQYYFTHQEYVCVCVCVGETSMVKHIYHTSTFKIKTVNKNKTLAKNINNSLQPHTQGMQGICKPIYIHMYMSILYMVKNIFPMYINMYKMSAYMQE